MREKNILEEEGWDTSDEYFSSKHYQAQIDIQIRSLALWAVAHVLLADPLRKHKINRDLIGKDGEDLIGQLSDAIYWMSLFHKSKRAGQIARRFYNHTRIYLR